MASDEEVVAALRSKLAQAEHQLAEISLASDGFQQRLAKAEQGGADLAAANKGLQQQMEGKRGQLQGLTARCQVPCYVSGTLLPSCRIAAPPASLSTMLQHQCLACWSCHVCGLRQTACCAVSAVS